MKGIKITFIICWGVLLTFGLYLGLIALKVKCWCNKLEVKPYTNCVVFQYNLETNYEIDEIKILIDSDFDVGLYFYSVKNIKYAGATTNFAFRSITFNTTTLLDKGYYTYALAHELTHLKYYNGDECWTNYMAWKYLYESHNTFLHNVGLWIASYITVYNSQDAYDCGWWILEYLK